MGIPGNRFLIFWGAFFVVLPDLNGLTVVFFIWLTFLCPNLHLIQHLVFNFFGEDFSDDDWLLVVDDSSSPYMLLPERGYCCRVGESTICHLLLRYLAAQSRSSVRVTLFWRKPNFSGGLKNDLCKSYAKLWIFLKFNSSILVGKCIYEIKFQESVPFGL